ncbi:MAG TPA: DNA mismatch repair endonuclease MutL [Terriglobales bacterium]|nr:DNA mismatch repair endonuclease MutL [Terriglobales bacterium]
MGVIRVLSDQIANKIAAGEVVERPASVVKELLENALDAGANDLRIEVEAGGRQRIRITDNGCGMVRDDALLALERHATSKLRDAAALSAIATLGFRGEALPSIAAVSHLTLETAPAGGGPGTRLEVAAGQWKSVGEAGLPAGTSITVSHLFVNIPARKKFLKSEATELGHITTLVTNYALAYPEVRFHLETPHRALLTLPPAANHAERLRQVFGAEMLGQCVEFRETAEWAPEEGGPGMPEAAEGSLPGLGLYGYASRPELQKLNRNSIFIFANRRLVRDRLLQHAIAAAYYNLLPNHAYPAVLLFLDLPYSEVDVNVHPAKTEVRFRRQGFVHDAVRDTIRGALSAARPVPSFLREREARATAAPAWSARPWSEPPDFGTNPLAVTPGAAPELGISMADLPAGFALTVAPPAPVAQRLPLAPPGPQPLMRSALPATGWVPETGTGCGLREIGPALPPEPGELGQLRPLGQIQESFIVAAGPSGLWLIDQHVAHERVLFEQNLANRGLGANAGQRLLLPRVVQLDPGRWMRYEEIAAELDAAGFESAPFGRQALAIQAAPAGIKDEQVERLLQEILQVAAAEDRGLTMEAVRTRIAATVACHAAIKVNMPLEKEKMEWLLAELAKTRYPMTCPHGRPVLLRYSMDEIQRAFKRIK